MKIKNGSKYGCDEVNVIGSGRLTYLWIGLNGYHVCNFSGEKTLRTLARKILKALPPTKRRKVKVKHD